MLASIVAPLPLRAETVVGTSQVEPPPSEEWELIRDEDEIRTYRGERTDSDLLVFKGEGVIDAPVDVVMSVCLDADRADEWIRLLSDSLVLRWFEDRPAYVQYSRFDLPWPVRDRMFVSRVAIDVDPKTFYTTLTYSESDEPPASDGAILGSTAGTQFILRPVDGGARTHFTGIGIADPKGAIPVWLVNWAGRSVPHQSLQALRRQVRKDDIAVLPLVESLYEGFEPEPRWRRAELTPRP